MPFPSGIRINQFVFDRYPRWGDVYWYDFGAPRAEQHTMADPHLAIVVSNTDETLRGTVMIVPISGAEHGRQGYMYHVPLRRSECPALEKGSIVKVDQIYSVPTRPGLPDQYCLTRLSLETMRRLYEPLLRALGVNYLVSRR